MEAGLQDGRVHPMEAKKRLASAVVARFHGDPAARAAEEAFARQFQSREVPTEVSPGPRSRPGSSSGCSRWCSGPIWLARPARPSG